VDQPEQVNNVFVIDTRMFGFEKYMSAYILKGKEIALIDTGFPAQLETVRAGIQARGFSVGDISRIFISHSHPDHSGNVGPLLRESPGARVYAHPKAINQLVDPSIEMASRKKALPEHLHARIGVIEPVPPERIQALNDGDTFDLGDGQSLRVIFAPGHLPDGVVFYQEKGRGLFINDLVGNCFLDAGAHYTLNPPTSDHRQGVSSLKKLLDLPLDYLYMGHYGITDRPREIMERSIEKMQYLLDMGRQFMRAGTPEKIGPATYAQILPELEKLRQVRGEELYHYAAREHITTQAEQFASFARENLKD
jgi:glyoxylase-like metal-dependent hydrolase (beta-lactamase superfamily II)